MSPAISLVIPVHNAASYLECCLASVKAQSFTDYEVICIDDASTDASKSMLDAAAAQDSRIRVLHRERNGGVSAARNRGLEAAQGRYVFFLDADDWIDPDHLAAMYGKAVQTGRNIIVNERWVKEFPDRSEPPHFKSILSGPSGVFPVATVQARVYPTVWSRLYRRDFLEANRLRFPESLQYGEDYYFSALAEVLQEDSYVFAGPPYHYRQRSGSLSRIAHPDDIEASILLYQAWQERAVPLTGLRLFYTEGPVITSEVQFDRIRDFFWQIRTRVHAAPELYSAFSIWCLDSLVGCPSYAVFRSRFPGGLKAAFARDCRLPHPAVTVIIPVYNTLRFLPRCLDSVRAQTLQSLEIICVDDCSTDGSGAWLDAAAREDPRIRVIHLPENGGVPVARNTAMDAARGIWLYFLDSDDWIDPDYLEAMVSHARLTGQDVVINANYIYEYDDPARNHPAVNACVKEGEDAFYNPRIVQQGFFPVVWTRLYRRSFILGTGLRFPILRGGVEDNYFIGLTEVLQERSYIFHGPAYHYYQREGSLIRTPGNGFRLIQNARLFYDELVRRGIPTRGLRLLYLTPDIDFRDEDEYRFARRFFLDARDAIRSDAPSYPDIVLIFMEIVLSCPDLASYRERCRPNFCVAYIREHGKGIKRHQ